MAECGAQRGAAKCGVANAKPDHCRRACWTRNHLTAHALTHITMHIMSASLGIAGAIDRAEPDPSSPLDPMRSWIGMVTATWDDRGGPLGAGVRGAAILKIATGCGHGEPRWGAHVVSLRWIGDPPPDEIAKAVYDLIVDGGPSRRDLSGRWVSQRRTAVQHSYRTASA